MKAIKRFFWGLPILRIHKESKDVTALIYRCIWLIENCPNTSVRITNDYIYIKTSSSQIELWNENKFYAWLSIGEVNGRCYKDLMPSINAMYDFKECLEKRGYDIHVKKPKPDLSLDDVNC